MSRSDRSAPGRAPTGLLGTQPATDVAAFDWRRPSKFGRDHVRALENAHDVFARRVSSSLGSTLRALVQVESVGIDQLTYDDYVRSLPNPNVLAVLGLPPLAGPAVLEMNVGFALQLVDRMLGGRGLPVDLRRPTDLELPLIRDLVMVGVRALGEALGPILDVTPELGLLETNPQMVQVTAPSDMVLLLSFRLTIAQGELTEGLLTLAYPSSTLVPALDRLTSAGGLAGEVAAARDAAALRRMTSTISEVTVELSARLEESAVRAADLLSLNVGDVLRLDHRVGQPAVLHVGGARVFEGHVGRRGRRLGIQITGTAAADAAAADAPPEDDPTSLHYHDPATGRALDPSASADLRGAPDAR